MPSPKTKFRYYFDGLIWISVDGSIHFQWFTHPAGWITVGVSSYEAIQKQSNHLIYPCAIVKTW